MAESQALTFASEEEREKAFMELPDEAPRGVNIDVWQAEIDAKKQEIETAQIVAGAAAPEQPPVTEDPPETTAADKVYDFGSIPASDLPEELRSYSSPGEIIKQFAHARKYANTVEQKLVTQEEQLAAVKAKADMVDKLQEEINQLKTKAQATIDSHKTTTQQKSVAQTNMDDLNAQLAILQRMDDDSDVNAKDIKDALTVYANELSKSTDTLNATRQEFASFREASKKEVESLKGELNTYLSQQKQISQQQMAAKQEKQADLSIRKLQESFPELKTTKSVMGNNGNSVEEDVVRFANRVSIMKTGRPAQNWAERNQIINSYLRGEPDVFGFCQNNGITPETVGATADDIKAYSLIANIDMHSRGMKIDPYTGQYHQLVNPDNGQPVNFPDHKAAYKWMRDEYGITQAERNQQLQDAEKQGQQNLQKSLEKRDLAATTLTPETSGSPDNIGQEITEDEATRILNTPDLEELIELNGRKGDAHWFDQYNKALKRIGLEEIPWENHWPARKA